MKISTQWSQREWDNALSKVWKLARNFDEILEFGLEHGYITSSDIIHASDMYKDPNKEYDDDEIKEIISSRGLRDIMGILQEEYSLDEILDDLPTDDILNNISEEDRLDSLEGSWTIDRYNEEIKNEVYIDYIDEWLEEFEKRNKDYINNLSNGNEDELHKFICNIVGCGYYENGLEKLKEKLNKNNYGVKYE